MKFLTIVKSRFKKDSKEDWVTERRTACKNCKYNTKNQTNISLRVRLIKLLSDFLTLITFAEKRDLGNCSICTCDLFFKSLEIAETCEATPSRWKSIYIPNKK